MTRPLHLPPLDQAEAEAYLAAVRRSVEEHPSDDELAAAVAALPGGAERLLELLGAGMALAFRPERAAGTRGVVRFVVETADGPVDLSLQLDEEGCRVAGGAVDADTVIRVALPVLLRIAFKQLTGTDAYLDGRVEASGDVVLANSLDTWFEAPTAAVAP